MRQDPCGGHGSAGWKGTETEPILFAVDLLCCKTRTFARAQSHMGRFCFPLSPLGKRKRAPQWAPPLQNRESSGGLKTTPKRGNLGKDRDCGHALPKGIYITSVLRSKILDHMATGPHIFSCKCFNVSPTWLKMAPKWLPISGAIFWNPNTKVPWMNGKNY